MIKSIVAIALLGLFSAANAQNSCVWCTNVAKKWNTTSKACGTTGDVSDIFTCMDKEDMTNLDSRTISISSEPISQIDIAYLSSDVVRTTAL